MLILEKKNENIENVHSRTVNSNDINCTCKIHGEGTLKF